jgi:hypothetical protein
LGPKGGLPGSVSAPANKDNCFILRQFGELLLELIKDNQRRGFDMTQGASELIRCADINKTQRADVFKHLLWMNIKNPFVLKVLNFCFWIYNH